MIRAAARSWAGLFAYCIAISLAASIALAAVIVTVAAL